MIDSSAQRWTMAFVLAMLLALLVGCDTPPKVAESQWSAERLYAEAKEEAAAGNPQITLVSPDGATERPLTTRASTAFHRSG